MVTSYWQWYNGLTEQQKREVDLQEYEEELKHVQVEDEGVDEFL